MLTDDTDDLDDLLDQIADQLEGLDDDYVKIRIIEEGLRRRPDSIDLLILWGNCSSSLVAFGDPRYNGCLEDSERAYERACALDPEDPRPYRWLGLHHDVFTDDYAAAERAYLRAIELDDGPASYAGLARVWAQQGVPLKTIFQMLDDCIYLESDEVQEMRSELAKGWWRPRE